jgi:ligand-binding sensor domain-containing protein
VGTEEGLNRFDQEKEQFMHYAYDPDNPYSLSDPRVEVIKKDSSGVLWIGTFGGA